MRKENISKSQKPSICDSMGEAFSAYLKLLFKNFFGDEKRMKNQNLQFSERIEKTLGIKMKKTLKNLSFLASKLFRQIE